VNTAIESTRKGGTITLVGNLSPRVEMPLQAIVTRELNVLGTCASSGEYPACIELLARGLICVDDMISARAPLEDGPEWFAKLYDGAPGTMKVILEPAR
jgi:L-iditol 2-dehydrogenase